MNRLIIIGNGFDLAHGMKTSFKDFMIDYYNKAVNTFIEKNEYKDDLLEITFQQDNDYCSDKRLIKFEETFEILEGFQNREEFKVTQSVLLKRIKSKMQSSNWVDIEMEYFNLLEASTHINSHIDLKKLNNELDSLKNKLVKYLKGQEDEHRKNEFDLSPLVNCFTQDIVAEDLFYLDKNTQPDSLYFLNFNYTNTLKPYLDECNLKISSDINYIHGTLYNESGEPIFGYGDEFDKKYLEFEDLKDNDYYRHIKSFEYSKTRNYFRLLSFLESDEFQVHIYGHSCGLSDRTMLNSIFENKLCKSIKIFYHQKDKDNNDFVEKTFDIYRHFKDKGEMRRKIVPYEVSEPMPQPVKKMVVG
ncbi:AbiH family protein [Ancylomarina sp. 16SWW S1-10-2]|uniref:AbiH family protein n=1 Tax=Ancylomarina sp. 16SWW S1-10-2 TaxID=2499681 RepID=UPI0012ADD6E6|nr:AbiH family protein [Ancylomarina sp. 16SWW S1-10-2]MRT93301.1 hypothetical protein [Ancylomarina sp. 16SWW S1-10-2]